MPIREGAHPQVAYNTGNPNEKIGTPLGLSPGHKEEKQFKGRELDKGEKGGGGVFNPRGGPCLQGINKLRKGNPGLREKETHMAKRSQKPGPFKVRGKG